MATLAPLTVPLNLDAAGFSSGIQAVEGGLGRLKSGVGTAMTGIAAGVTALSVVGVKAAIDWESSFAGVRKTVDATEEQFAALETGIRNMAREMPASANEIAGVAEAAGQLGIQTDNILGFSKTMVQLGTATNMSATDAATSLARLANITQMPQTEFDRLGSTVVALGNNLATTESEIVEMGLRLAGAGAQVGMTEAQILGFAGALSSVGIEAQAGGSAFSKVMINMASDVATGGGKLQQFAAVAGLSASEFQAAFRDDAAGAVITFVEGLGRISEEGGNVFGVLDELGLSEIRVRDALLRAAGAGDLFRESISLASGAWEENTALTNEAAQRYATMESQLQMLKNDFTEVAISIGQALMPSLQSFVAMARDVATVVIDWIHNNGELVNSVLPIVAAVSGLITVLTGARVLGSVLGPIAPMFGAISAAAAPLLGIITAIAAPILIAVGAFLAFQHAVENNIAGMGQFAPLLDSIRETLGILADAAGQAIGIFGDMFGAIMSGGDPVQVLSEGFGRLGELVLETAGQIPFLGEVVAGLQPFFDALRQTVDALAPVLVDLAHNILGGLASMLDHVGPYVQLLFEHLGKLGAVVGEKIGPLLNALLPILSDWGRIIGSVLNDAFSALGRILDALFPLFQKLSDVIVGAVAWAFDALTGVLTFLGPILSFIGEIVGGYLSFVFEFWAGVIEAVVPIVMTLADIIGGVLNIAFQAIGVVVDVVIGYFKLLWDVWSAVASFLAPAVGAAFTLVGDVINGVAGLIQDVWNGLLSWIGNLIGGIIGFVGDLVGFFEFIPGPIGEGAAKIKADLQGVADGFKAWGDTAASESQAAASSVATSSANISSSVGMVVPAFDAAASGAQASASSTSLAWQGAAGQVGGATSTYASHMQSAAGASDQFQRSSATAFAGVPTAFGSTTSDTLAMARNFGPDMGSTLASGAPRVTAGADSLFDAAERGLAPLPGMATTTGLEGGYSFASGIDATAGQSGAAGTHLRDAANKEFATLRVLSQQAGQWGGQLYAKGIEERISWVEQAASNMRSGAIRVLGVVNDFYQSGLRTIQTYAQGISAGASAAIAAAQRVATSVRNVLRATSPPVHPLLHDIGKWGFSTIVEYARGIERALPIVDRALGRIPAMYRDNVPLAGGPRLSFAGAPTGAGGGTFSGDINLSININGATDPRATADHVREAVREELGELLGDTRMRFLPAMGGGG
jgi:TP901 family phage tail tape measure protein